MREGFRNPAARVAATDIYVFTYALSIAPGERALDVARRCERSWQRPPGLRSRPERARRSPRRWSLANVLVAVEQLDPPSEVRARAADPVASPAPLHRGGTNCQPHGL